MHKPAIVVVTYNRFDSFVRLLNSISKAVYKENDIPLIISIDHHPDNQNTIDYANDFEWKYGEKKVVTHEKRMGLKEHVLECSDNSITYGSVIVLEDDLIVSKDFYIYAACALDHYDSDDRIAGISLYSYEWNNFARLAFRPVRTGFDTYFRQTCESWGQAYTGKQWERFREWIKSHYTLERADDMPAEVYIWPETSWGKYFNKYVVENNLFLAVPYEGRSSCCSEAGQHTDKKNVAYQVCMETSVSKNYRFPSFDEGIHYDLFYESMDLDPYLSEWTGGEKCRIDIYGLHTDGEERYLLSTKALPHKVLFSFALDLRPPEMNVIDRVCGKDVFLYDMSAGAKSPKAGSGMIGYDLSGYGNSDIVKYGFMRIKEHFAKKIRSVLFSGKK